MADNNINITYASTSASIGRFAGVTVNRHTCLTAAIFSVSCTFTIQIGSSPCFLSLHVFHFIPFPLISLHNNNYFFPSTDLYLSSGRCRAVTLRS